MSDRQTEITLPGFRGAGLGKWGRHSPRTMIDELRKHARHRLETAQAILAADDEDFQVETFIGPYARKNRVVLQQSRRTQE